MKVTIENKKGLNKDLKVFIDKQTISSYMNEKYEEVKNTVTLKGFRPGKVPKEILKKQFGQAIFGEVLDKILKDTSSKALQENKIKPAGQPKIDLKTYGEDKDLEYVISVTELPKIDIKSLENIKFDEFKVKIDAKETPIGYVPFKEDIDTSELDISEENLNALLAIDPDQWLVEMDAIKEYFNEFGEQLPNQLLNEHAKVVDSLNKK